MFYLTLISSNYSHGDAEGYRRFLNFLLKCETISQMQTWNVLDTLEVMDMLLSKLPDGKRDKWCWGSEEN